jgi:hypothetical protein
MSVFKIKFEQLKKVLAFLKKDNIFLVSGFQMIATIVL